MKKILHPTPIILICLAICFTITTNIHWGKNKWRNIIEADAKGYYAYLPAVFIYHDLNFSFYDSIEKKKYYDNFLVYDYRATAPNGQRIDKYYCGTAIAQLPFFLVAHALTHITGGDADGFSRYYLLAITLAALFYLFIGLWFINNLLALYNIHEKARSISIVALLFGSNLFFYSVCEMGMSHVYSFAFVAMFCYYVKKYFLHYQSKHLFLSMVLLGMIFLIRPVNVLIVLAIPFFAGSLSELISGFYSLKRNLKAFISGAIAMLLLLGIQSLIYKISTGQFWIYSYGEEGFNFTDPHFMDILFSYKKGLFLYTPVYLVSLGGIYFMYRKNRFQAAAFFSFLAIITYVLSSWWSWWYGGSFSSRVYVEFIPLFAIALGFLLQSIQQKVAKISINVLLVLLIILCQLQTYQYRYYIIHWENMTKEKYWDVFLRLDKKVV